MFEACGGCISERDALVLQVSEAKEIALKRNAELTDALNARDTAERLNGELVGALRDILADHDERVRSYPGAPEENPHRLRVMNVGRAILNKTEKRKCECTIPNLEGIGISIICTKCGNAACQE